MVTKRGKQKGGIDWETEIETYTLLYKNIQQVRTYCIYRNSTQHSVMTYMRKESKKKSGYMYMYVASLMAQWIKNPPAMQELQETWVQSLDEEDTLELVMQPAPVFLPEKKSHGQKSLVGYSPKCRKGLDTREPLSGHTNVHV